MVFGTGLKTMRGPRNPVPPQFHVSDGKTLALGSSGQPCSGQRGLGDIFLPGFGGLGGPFSPGTMCPAAGPGVL